MRNRGGGRTAGSDVFIWLTWIKCEKKRDKFKTWHTDYLIKNCRTPFMFVHTGKMYNLWSFYQSNDHGKLFPHRWILTKTLSRTATKNWTSYLLRLHSGRKTNRKKPSSERGKGRFFGTETELVVLIRWTNHRVQWGQESARRPPTCVHNNIVYKICRHLIPVPKRRTLMCLFSLFSVQSVTKLMSWINRHFFLHCYQPRSYDLPRSSLSRETLYMWSSNNAMF